MVAAKGRYFRGDEVGAKTEPVVPTAAIAVPVVGNAPKTSASTGQSEGSDGRRQAQKNYRH